MKRQDDTLRFSNVIHNENFFYQLHSISDEEGLAKFIDMHSDALSECGVYVRLTMANRDEVLIMMCLHHCVLKSIAEIEQIMSGLSTLGVMEAMKSCSGILKEFFVPNELNLTAGNYYLSTMMLQICNNVFVFPLTDTMMKLFLINYSVNDRQKEEEAVEVFKQYLKLCEGNLNCNNSGIIRK